MQIQKRLLSEANLKYSKAVEIAVAMENAIHDASELQSELNPNLGPSRWQVDWTQQTNSSETGDHPPLLPLWWEHAFDTQLFLQGPENRAISSEFVVQNSKASLSKQPKPQRYMLLTLMLMLMRMKTY